VFFWQQHPQAAQLQDVGGAGNDTVTAAGFSVGSPVIGSPSITQNHQIGAAGFAVGSPVIGSVALASGTNDVVTGTGFAVASPVIGSPAITQNHRIAGAGFAVGSPVIGAAQLFGGGDNVVTGVGFAVGSPVIGAAALAGSLVDPGIPAGDIGGGRNRDAASRWLEIERARLKREKARRRSAERAIAEGLKDPPKAAREAARAVGDLSDGARVTLAALLEGMSPRTAAVVAGQVESVLAARAREATARAKKEAEAARLWLAEVQAVLDEQARVQAEDDEVLMLLLAA
jgi:hypothetical protein